MADGRRGVLRRRNLLAVLLSVVDRDLWPSPLCLTISGPAAIFVG